MSADKKGLTDEELKVVFDAEQAAAMGELGGELTTERTTAMERYLGEPMGNELEGRSAVQARDVMDVIEWILPSLIRMFTNAKSSVMIEPVGPEDEEAAKQETDVVNHYFWKKNEGFLIIYTWFKDALLQKNGIVKLWMEEKDEKKREEYSNLVEEEYLFHMANDDLELIEHTVRKETADDGRPVEVHDAVFLNSAKKLVTNIDNIPPEEFLISTDARTVFPRDARFTAHHTEKTVSDLREMGFSEQDIMMMEDGINSAEFEEESYTRKHLSDEQRHETAHDANSALKTKKITEGYMFADKNGDGVAELLKVFRSGDFIESDEIEENPFHALTPIILTHKFFGLSIADIVTDIQEIRTALLRSQLDNVYQTINGTTYYDENTVNIEDMLTSKPYGNRGVDGPPGQSILHIPPGGLPPEAFTMMDMMKDLRADRIGDFQSQLDPNVLANANNGVVVEMLNEAKAKVEMIARIFAETGVKSVFRGLHTLLRKNVDKEELLKLRNQWVPVDPSSWRERTDFTVKVGLGIRNKQEEAASLSAIMDKQMQMLQTGQLAPVHVDPQTGQPIAFPMWESAQRFAEILGEENPDQFFPNPMTIPPPPPEPADPNLAVLELTAQVEAQKDQTTQVKNTMTNQVDQAKLALEAQKMQSKNDIEQLNLQIKAQDTQAKAQQQASKFQVDELTALLKAERQQQDIGNEEAKIRSDERSAEQDRRMQEFEAQLQAATTIVTSDALPEDQKALASGAMLASLVDEISGLKQQISAPKSFIRDETGLVTQVGNQRVIRDDSGNVLRLE